MDKFVHYDFDIAFNSGITLQETALFFKLAIAAGKSNSCRISVPTIASWLKVTEKWVRKSIRRLEAAGLIEVGRSVGGQRCTNTYSIVKTSTPPQENRVVDNRCSEVSEPGLAESQNPGSGKPEPRFSATPEKKIYKRREKEEIKEARAAESVPPAMGRGTSRLEKKESAQGVCSGNSGYVSAPPEHREPLSAFSSYPETAEVFEELFPDTDIQLIGQYLSGRRAHNWMRPDGTRIPPSEIAVDFAMYMLNIGCA